MAKFQAVPFTLRQTNPETPAAVSSFISKGGLLLGLVKMHPDNFPRVEQSLPADCFESEFEKKLYNQLLLQYHQPASQMRDKRSEADEPRASEEREQSPFSKPDPEDQQRLTLLEIFAQDRYEGFSLEALEKEIERLTASLRQDYKKRRLQALRVQMSKEKDQNILQADARQAVRSGASPPKAGCEAEDSDGKISEENLSQRRVQSLLQEYQKILSEG